MAFHGGDSAPPVRPGLKAAWSSLVSLALSLGAYSLTTMPALGDRGRVAAQYWMLGFWSVALIAGVLGWRSPLGKVAVVLCFTPFLVGWLVLLLYWVLSSFLNR